MIQSIITPEIKDDNPKGSHVKDGFQDASGSLPSIEYIGKSGLNFRAQGDVTDQITNRTYRSAKAETSEIQQDKKSLIEPDIPNQSIYPYNRVIKTSAGHIIELDNTPGHERIMIKHRTGSKIEMRANGSVKIISTKDRYTAIAGDDELVVRGNVSLVLESDAAVRVQGDMTIQVDGDLNTLVHGDYNIEVDGDYNERVHGDKVTTITGTYLRDIRGSVTERNLSNYLCWTTGTYTSNVGGALEFTTEETIKLVSNGELSMECEGGFIDLKTDESYVKSGISYFINSHLENSLFAEELHSTEAYFTDLDVVNTIEGTASKSQYATTAGAAPTGSASPTTPSPTSPTNQEDAPENSLAAVEVVDNSGAFISEIDRSVYYDNKYNKRKLNTYEVWARLNNPNLRYDSIWLQDQVDYGAILDNATSSDAPNPKRTFTLNNNRIGTGSSSLGNRHTNERAFRLDVPKKPLVDVIPEQFKIETASRSTKLSPNFTMASMLGGDNDIAQLIDQGGLSKEDIAKNCQLISFNILEEFRNKYFDKWTISQGVYNLLDQEKLSSSSINLMFLQGLAVGIQFDEEDKSIYYDAAVWAANNLVFDKIILSYINYDPLDINEPTLIVSLKNGNNAKSLETHYNNEMISNTLQDLS